MMSVNLKHDLFSLFFFNIPYRTPTVEIKNKMKKEAAFFCFIIFYVRMSFVSRDIF